MYLGKVTILAMNMLRWGIQSKIQALQTQLNSSRKIREQCYIFCKIKCKTNESILKANDQFI